MNGIKALLVGSFAALLVWAFRNRRRVGLQAGGRLAAIALAALAVASVLEPNLTQWFAESLGVTRGTDLVLYLFIVVSVTSAITSRLRFRDLEQRVSEVVRAMALREAVLINGLPGDDRAAEDER